MGMVDRGASLSWLSQYPFEQEILCPPLTGIGVEANRCEGSVIVIDVRLSVNFTSLSIEQSIAKLQRSNLQLIDLILGDLRFARAPKPALAQLESLKLEHSRRPPAAFNHIDVFRSATQAVLDAQREAFAAPQVVPPLTAKSPPPALPPPSESARAMSAGHVVQEADFGMRSACRNKECGWRLGRRQGAAI